MRSPPPIWTTRSTTPRTSRWRAAFSNRKIICRRWKTNKQACCPITNSASNCTSAPPTSGRSVIAWCCFTPGISIALADPRLFSRQQVADIFFVPPDQQQQYDAGREHPLARQAKHQRIDRRAGGSGQRGQRAGGRRGGEE